MIGEVWTTEEWGGQRIGMGIKVFGAHSPFIIVKSISPWARIMNEALVKMTFNASLYHETSVLYFHKRF